VGETVRDARAEARSKGTIRPRGIRYSSCLFGPATAEQKGRAREGRGGREGTDSQGREQQRGTDRDDRERTAEGEPFERAESCATSRNISLFLPVERHVPRR
jgi:hypothetical protein